MKESNKSNKIYFKKRCQEYIDLNKLQKNIISDGSFVKNFFYCKNALLEETEACIFRLVTVNPGSIIGSLLASTQKLVFYLSEFFIHCK